MFRSVLIAVKPAAKANAEVDFALALAGRQQLVIEAIAVIDAGRLAPAEAVPLGGGAFKTERDEQLLDTAQQLAAEAMTRLEAQARQRSLECHTRVVAGDTVTTLAEAAQLCDALICGHTAGGDSGERSLLFSIVKHAPRPAIIVPQSEPAGSAVLVAYDGSAQAARALASFAGSGLAAGRSVHVISVVEGLPGVASPADTADAYLRQHGISCQTRTVARTNNLSQQILEEATSVSAGLIVMGAFGQNAMREFFFGSVTKSILNALPCPVFLDH